jgi:hypothetical protein
MENVPIRWHLPWKIYSNGIFLFSNQRTRFADGSSQEEVSFFNNASHDVGQSCFRKGFNELG